MFGINELKEDVKTIIETIELYHRDINMLLSLDDEPVKCCTCETTEGFAFQLKEINDKLTELTKLVSVVVATNSQYKKELVANAEYSLQLHNQHFKIEAMYKMLEKMQPKPVKKAVKKPVKKNA